MSRVKFPMFSGKIALDGYIVPYDLTVVHNDETGRGQDLNGFCDEHCTETLNFLQRIVRELVSGNNYDGCSITTLNGLKCFSRSIKEGSKLSRSGSRSYLSLDCLQGDEIRCKQLLEFDRRVKASVYALPKPCKNLGNADTSQKISVLNACNRIEALEKCFASCKPTTNSDEQKLKESIKELELEYESLKQKSGGCDVKSFKVNLKRMREITDEEIREQFAKSKNELVSIFNGKLKCQRHLDYMQGGVAKRNLDYQCYFLRFHKIQIDLAVKCIESIFKTHEDIEAIESQTLDYIMRVLLPEFLARLCMDMRNVSYEEAEKKLCGNYLSEDESEAFLGDLTQNSSSIN